MRNKTKAQLSAEIEAQKKRLVEPQAVKAETHQENDILKKQAHTLEERVKELNCLYDISSLVETPGISLLEILRGCVELLPPAWQYPQITCARITLRGREYKTKNFRETKWKLSREIEVEGKRVGAVAVFYLEKRPKSDVGPFLKEEQELIKAVAEHLGKIIQRMEARNREEHLALLLRAIRSVNQLIVREKNRGVLIQEVCGTLTKTHGYSTAWIMLLDERGEYLDCAQSGFGKGFTPLLKELKRGNFPACARQALTQPGPVEIKNPSRICAECPIKDKYSEKGRMAVRLEHSGKVYGVLSFSFRGDFTVDEEEVYLFKEVAVDLAIGLYTIKQDENAARAEKKLQEYAEYQKTIFETTSVATVIIESDTTLSMVNAEFEKLSGYSKEELEGKKSWTEFVAAEDLERMRALHQQRRIDPDAALKQYEFRFINRKGAVRNILLHVDLIPGTKKSVASLLDITERMQAQQEKEMLLALSRKASSETSLNDLLFFVADQIVEIIPHAEASSIFLTDQEKKAVKVRAWAGFDDSDIEGLEFPIGERQVGRIFRTGKPAIIKDASKDPDFNLIDKGNLRYTKSQ
ncbi:MAG: PAS domain S-box protein, partial [Anaerolineaceae bacterium]|nr:PAS domain S-box protein [Anaerolineaceae bacterium]